MENLQSADSSMAGADLRAKKDIDTGQLLSARGQAEARTAGYRVYAASRFVHAISTFIMPAAR